MTPPRWHYTVGLRWADIQRSGLLRLATAGLVSTERPALWASTHPGWEQTANKMVQLSSGAVRSLTREETFALAGGGVRIALRPEDVPHHWWAHRRLSRMKDKTAAFLVRRARQLGADPEHWWTTFDPIPADRWLGVEYWWPATQTWQDHTPPTPAPEATP